MIPGSRLRLTILRVLRGSRDHSSMINFPAVVGAIQLTVSQHYWFPGEPFNPHLHLIFTTSLGMLSNGLATFCLHFAEARCGLTISETDDLNIVVTAMALSLMTCDLGAVFELIGATSACAVSGHALRTQKT